jgi:hypothetical protein
VKQDKNGAGCQPARTRLEKVDKTRRQLIDNSTELLRQKELYGVKREDG